MQGAVISFSSEFSRCSPCDENGAVLRSGQLLLTDRAQVMVGIGFIDTISPPAGIWTALNQLAGPK